MSEPIESISGTGKTSNALEDFAFGAGFTIAVIGAYFAAILALVWLTASLVGWIQGSSWLVVVGWAQE